MCIRDRAYIDQIKSWLIDQGAAVHEPIGEADQTLIVMENLGIIDLIVTNDSDLIALGAETVVRNNVLLSKTHMRKQMGFTNECWKDFMYLCRRMEPLIAYSMIRVYKEYAVERWETLYT